MDLKAEKELVEKAKKDPQAFGEIYELHYQKIFNFILSRTGNVAVAQDLTSETFLRALEKLWQFKWVNVPFASWLYKIASNRINTYFRKGKTSPGSLDELFEAYQFEPVSDQDIEEELNQAQEELEKHQDFLAIKNLLSKIPKKYQEVVSMRYLEQKKIGEIAEILQKKEGTVRALLSRGLDRLEQLYKQNRSPNQSINFEQ